jgi:hypothetical protein
MTSRALTSHFRQLHARLGAECAHLGGANRKSLQNTPEFFRISLGQAIIYENYASEHKNTLFAPPAFCERSESPASGSLTVQTNSEQFCTGSDRDFL